MDDHICRLLSCLLYQPWETWRNWLVESKWKTGDRHVCVCVWSVGVINWINVPKKTLPISTGLSASRAQTWAIICLRDEAHVIKLKWQNLHIELYLQVRHVVFLPNPEDQYQLRSTAPTRDVHHLLSENYVRLTMEDDRVHPRYFRQRNAAEASCLTAAHL